MHDVPLVWGKETSCRELILAWQSVGSWAAEENVATARWPLESFLWKIRRDLQFLVQDYPRLFSHKSARSIPLQGQTAAAYIASTWQKHVADGNADPLGTKSLEYVRGLAQYIHEQHEARARVPVKDIPGLTLAKRLALHEAEGPPLSTP